MKRYHRGQTVYMYYQNYTNADVLTDCDSGYPKITLTDPSGNDVVEEQEMASTGTGESKYDSYDLSSTAEFGWWNEKVEARTGGDVTFKFDGFWVV